MFVKKTVFRSIFFEILLLDNHKFFLIYINELWQICAFFRQSYVKNIKNHFGKYDFSVTIASIISNFVHRSSPSVSLSHALRGRGSAREQNCFRPSPFQERESKGEVFRVTEYNTNKNPEFAKVQLYINVI